MAQGHLSARLLLASCIFVLVLSYDTFVNPVVDVDSPDPGVMYYQGIYWMVTTSGGLPAYPIRWSNDLVNWTQVGYVFTEDNKPDWVSFDVSCVGYLKIDSP